MSSNPLNRRLQFSRLQSSRLSQSRKAPVLDPGADVSVGDWGKVVDAVGECLRELTASEAEAHAVRPGNGASHRPRASPSDCIAALHRVRAAVQRERAWHRQVQREVRQTRAILARMCAELEGTRDGEARARYLALHDELTALPNRRSFLETLERALHGQPRSSTLAVLYLDLDDFKPLNDAHGHGAGDEALRIVAARLAGAVRAHDMMSRLGGDEFGCLVVDVPSRNRLCHMARKLLDAAAAPLSVGGSTLTVRASIGIAIYPDDATTPDALLRCADQAMYQAKRERVGFAFFGL
jgi:diguanylate cyclase